MSVLDTVNITDVQTKVYEKLKPSGWGDKLKTFIMSDDFKSILEKLLTEAREGKRFTPVIKYLDRKSTRLNSSHIPLSRMPSSA